MVQNMSVFTCPHCSQSTHIFGSEGVARECSTQDIDFLGDIPLHAGICDDADRGKPTVVSDPNSPHGQAFLRIADRVGEKIQL